MDLGTSTILNWITGGFFSFALLIQVFCYVNPRKLSMTTLICFAIANILSFIQSIFSGESSLYIPSGIQTLCILWILITQCIKQYLENHSDSHSVSEHLQDYQDISSSSPSPSPSPSNDTYIDV
jgi:hypothetical protein